MRLSRPKAQSTWNQLVEGLTKDTTSLSRPKAQSTWNKHLQILKKPSFRCLSRPKAQSTWNLLKIPAKIVSQASQSPEGSIYMEFCFRVT